MRSSRWQSFNPVWNQLQQFQDEMNHLFNRWGNGSSLGSTSSFPALNVWEDGDKVFVEAELPGLNLKDLEIYVSGGNQLTIKGERKPCRSQECIWHRQERTFGVFSRSLAALRATAWRRVRVGEGSQGPRL